MISQQVNGSFTKFISHYFTLVFTLRLPVDNFLLTFSNIRSIVIFVTKCWFLTISWNISCMTIKTAVWATRTKLHIVTTFNKKTSIPYTVVRLVTIWFLTSRGFQDDKCVHLHIILHFILSFISLAKTQRGLLRGLVCIVKSVSPDDHASCASLSATAHWLTHFRSILVSFANFTIPCTLKFLAPWVWEWRHCGITDEKARYWSWRIVTSAIK